MGIGSFFEANSIVAVGPLPGDYLCEWERKDMGASGRSGRNWRAFCYHGGSILALILWKPGFVPGGRDVSGSDSGVGRGAGCMAHGHVPLGGGLLLFNSQLSGAIDAGNAAGIDGKSEAGCYALFDGEFCHGFSMGNGIYGGVSDSFGGGGDDPTGDGGLEETLQRLSFLSGI